MAPHLTPEDWIKAAFRRLGQGGIGAVRAEGLARDLGVSKGSFYWHFVDLPDLKAQMLAHWRDQATTRIVALAEAAGDDPMLRLLRLMDLATSDLAEPYGGLSTEAAIRDWARTDAAAALAQSQSDEARLAYLTQVLDALVPRATPEDQTAERTARLILMAYTGAVHQGIPDRATLSRDLAYLLDRLLTPEPSKLL